MTSADREPIVLPAGSGPAYAPLGWYDLIADVVARLNEIAPGLWICRQVKPKLGGLRLYIWTTAGATRETILALDAAVAEAEQRSLRICEVCGAAAERRQTDWYWVETKCPEHVGVRPEEAALRIEGEP